MHSVQNSGFFINFRFNPGEGNWKSWLWPHKGAGGTLTSKLKFKS
jgi:hypothetical protein